jgi:transcriptional regulator with XRE-family HTH domain
MKNSSAKSSKNALIFGKRLRERRIHLNLSQESLGVSIGLDESCSRTRISRYESGLHEPKIATAQLIANELDIPLAYLYCEKDAIAELLLELNLMTEEQIKIIIELAGSMLD